MWLRRRLGPTAEVVTLVARVVRGAVFAVAHETVGVFAVVIVVVRINAALVETGGSLRNGIDALVTSETRLGGGSGLNLRFVTGRAGKVLVPVLECRHVGGLNAVGRQEKGGEQGKFRFHDGSPIQAFETSVPAMRPKTPQSITEHEVRRFAPWTPEAASPAA